MSEVFAVVFASAGLAFSIASLLWINRKVRQASKAEETRIRDIRRAKFEVIDALEEWDEAARMSAGGLYSSRLLTSGTELARLLKAHVLGITTAQGGPQS